ncbi:hypothetical protein H5410_012001 [Solanum commersonii]|uniref:Uncharacterized protein n=1 Tax=Solanum commersonii TaxID=4109 RepID=A0A9J6ARM0_SOLCO|nr:hypothetical protein H5410_012001 [Solanum commersonii]
MFGQCQSGLNWKMLMGHAEGVSKLGSSTKLLLSDPESESDGDEEADTPEKILYVASFDELRRKVFSMTL